METFQEAQEILMSNNEYNKIVNTLFCFGDSWGAGAELKPGEQPFAQIVATALNIHFDNYSMQGHSLGIILHSIVSNVNKLQPDDTVIVVVPPDTRWYDENEKDGFYSLMKWDDDYFKFLNKKTLDWFTYHHAMFVYTIQKTLNDVGCYYVMAHNYGQIDEYKKYNFQIDYQKFLSDTNLTQLLTNEGKQWDSYPEHLKTRCTDVQDGPPELLFTGKYFEGCQQHPNQLGHQRIAELILEKIDRDKK